MKIKGFIARIIVSLIVAFPVLYLVQEHHE